MTAALQLIFRPDRTALAALPALHVRETMRPLPVEPLADAPSFVIGATVVRGRAVPVIDASALFSGDKADATRWIALEIAGRSAILAVHAVIGVRLLDTTASPPALLTRSLHGALAELGALDGELLAVLRAAYLVDEAQASMGRERAD